MLDMHLADIDGRQIMALLDADLDAQLNSGNRDFELTMPVKKWDERIRLGCRFFIPGSEIGGIIGEVETSTKTGEAVFRGYLWRGLLEKKIIVPPSGADHYMVSGELNEILREVIEKRFGGLFVVPRIDTGITISRYVFDRFTTVLEGTVKMLKSVKYRLNIRYVEGEPNGTGYVEVSAVPIIDYSEQIEFSQDSRMQFKVSQKRNGVNHLIIGGKGDMQDRNVIHLYVQKDGSIGKTKYYTGIEEIESFYENTSTDTADVEKKGKEQLEKLMNRDSMSMDMERSGMELEIGDIVGGRDYITGIYMKQPIEDIVIKKEKGRAVKKYKLEGTE